MIPALNQCVYLPLSKIDGILMFLCIYGWLLSNLFAFSEQMRQTDRVIRKTQRDLEHERHDLERQEKKLVRWSCVYFCSMQNYVNFHM